MMGGRQQEGWGGSSQDKVVLNLAQRISILLQQENARAVLRRMDRQAEEGAGNGKGPGWGNVGGEGLEEEEEKAVGEAQEMEL